VLRQVGVFLVFLGCGCGAPSTQQPSVRPGTAGRLDPVARALFDALTSGEPARIETLRARDAQLGELFDPGFLDVVLSQRHAESRGHERIASEWRPYAGGRMQGWCARGVGPGVTALPGLGASVPAIGELVLAGRDAAGEWAGVVRDLVQTPDGYRLVRWTIDAPRRDHYALEQWSCDFGTRR
jgi:hypothetical protein